jgi:tyrosyl-tRNA synthetase
MAGTMLEGTDGRKMSTSWGNIITIVDEPFDMFGKLMSLRDDLIVKYFTLCTDIPLKEIHIIEKDLKSDANPKDIKMRLANEIVTMYHSEKDAALAKKSWIEAFQNKGFPEDVPTFSTTKEKELGDILVENKIVSSKTDWRRLVKEGAVTDAEGNTITNIKLNARNIMLKIGKKRFAKIIVTE